MQPPSAGRLAGTRVLVVDDDDDARALLAELLALEGAIVESAASAAEAFERAASWGPDVVVSDIGMPGEDGYSLVRRLRARPESSASGLVAVALTAFAREQDRARALEAGFHAHLTKPVDPEALFQSIAKWSKPAVRA